MHFHYQRYAYADAPEELCTSAHFNRIDLLHYDQDFYNGMQADFYLRESDAGYLSTQVHYEAGQYEIRKFEHQEFVDFLKEGVRWVKYWSYDEEDLSRLVWYTEEQIEGTYSFFQVETEEAGYRYELRPYLENGTITVVHTSGGRAENGYAFELPVQNGLAQLSGGLRVEHQPETGNYLLYLDYSDPATGTVYTHLLYSDQASSEEEFLRLVNYRYTANITYLIQ